MHMKRFIRISLIILLLGLISYMSYNVIMKWHRGEVEYARMQVRDELKAIGTPDIPEEKLNEVFGKAPKEIPGQEKQTGVEETERQVMAFFSYLDEQDYVKAYNLKGGTFRQFQQIVEQLSSTPPVVAGETQSLYTLFKNMSHFFRIMGIERINLVKEILYNESEIMESVMETFYAWFTMNNNVSTRQGPSPKVLYQYAGYFSNTLAGRSYLLRRDPKVRILTMYYSVLILDRANDALLNSHGIDIRPYIQGSLDEIRNQYIFINKKQYLSELEKLEEKYQS